MVRFISFIKLTWNTLNWLRIFCCLDLNFLFIGRWLQTVVICIMNCTKTFFVLIQHVRFVCIFPMNGTERNETEQAVESRNFVPVQQFHEESNKTQTPLCYSIKTSKLFLGLCEFKSIFWTKAKWQSICSTICIMCIYIVHVVGCACMCVCVFACCFYMKCTIHFCLCVHVSLGWRVCVYDWEPCS